MYTNSPLIKYTHRSPMHSGLRKHIIDTISIHCMAGDLSVEECGKIFQTKKASSNYGIGSDGRIALYVDEKNRSWCTSSSSNDNRAITIEVANIENKEPFRVSDAAYKSLIKLCADICWRNNIKRLLWKGDKTLIGQVDKQNMTVHRWFENKSCPGNWLYQNHDRIAADVNKMLEELEDENMTQEQFNKMFAIAMNEYRKNLQDNDAGSWSNNSRKWAVQTGLIKGGTPINGQPNYMWEDFLTREQMAELLYRFKDIK